MVESHRSVPSEEGHLIPVEPFHGVPSRPAAKPWITSVPFPNLFSPDCIGAFDSRRVVENNPVASTLPSASMTAGTCRSLWVSTPPITRRGLGAMLALPASFGSSRAHRYRRAAHRFMAVRESYSRCLIGIAARFGCRPFRLVELSSPKCFGTHL